MENYDYQTENILKEWGILLAYALAGTVSLEFVDRDKR